MKNKQKTLQKVEKFSSQTKNWNQYWVFLFQSLFTKYDVLFRFLTVPITETTTIDEATERGNMGKKPESKLESSPNGSKSKSEAITA